MLDFLTEEFILTVEVSMALAELHHDVQSFLSLPTVEDYAGSAPALDTSLSRIFKKNYFGEAILLERVNKDGQEALTAPLEKVSETRPPAHMGEMPDAINILFEETGVFAAVARAEQRTGNIVEFKPRQAEEHPVYSASERIAGDS